MEASSRIEELEEIVKQLISKEQENEKIILQQEQLINQLLINNEEIKNKIQKIEEKGTKMEIVVRNRNNCTFTINIMSTDQLSMIFNKMEYDETKYDLSYLGIVLNPLYTFVMVNS